MPKQKRIVNVTFPPQFGRRSGKEYAYLWDGEVYAGQSAVVKTNDGRLELVRVVSVESYKPLPYMMKWLVQVIDESTYNNRLTDFE